MLLLLLLGQHLSRLSVVITACQNANRNLLTFLSRIRLVGRTGLMLIDLDMRKIFSNACDVRRDASHTLSHTRTLIHTLEKDSGNELQEKATRAVCVAGCDTTRHEVIARSSSVNCNSIQCDQLAQSQPGNKVRCPYWPL